MADALQHYSAADLLTLMREKKNEVDETGQALDHIISTLEGIIASSGLWEKVTVPGPRTDGPAGHAAGDHTQQRPEGPPADDAENLASHAQDRLGDPPQNTPPTPPRAPSGAGSGPAGSGGRYGRWGYPTRRVQILALLEKDPQRWWPAQELSEAIGVPHHRQLRGILSEMVLGGDLQRRKEFARVPASYRPAPTPAPQEETAMSG
ncbi:hypothetical protein [Streptomyces niveus]|uniref:hypothetical protein n=1 Tax=Streptomyces niveus TaxID=193462 RepID=UPI0033CFB6DF